MKGYSFRTIFWLFCIRKISFKPLRTERIGLVPWPSSFVCAAAGVGCFLVGIRSKCLRYYFSNLAILTLVAQSGGAHSSAVCCYPYNCLLVLRITHPSSWRTGLAHPDSDIGRLWNIAFHTVLRFLVVALDQASVTNIPTLIYLICFMIFLSHYWRTCGLMFTTPASVILLTGLHLIMRLLT